MEKATDVLEYLEKRVRLHVEAANQARAQVDNVLAQKVKLEAVINQLRAAIEEDSHLIRKIKKGGRNAETD